MWQPPDRAASNLGRTFDSYRNPDHLLGFATAEQLRRSASQFSQALGISELPAITPRTAQPYVAPLPPSDPQEMPTNVNMNELGGASVSTDPPIRTGRPPIRTCPVCDTDLPGLSLSQMEAHINHCLDEPQMSDTLAEQVSPDQPRETVSEPRAPLATPSRETLRSETTADRVRSNMSPHGRSDSLYSFECSSAERIANIGKVSEQRARTPTREPALPMRSNESETGHTPKLEGQLARPDSANSSEQSSASRVEMYNRSREMYANQGRSPPQAPTSRYQAYSLPEEEELRNASSFEANARFSFPWNAAGNTIPRTLPEEGSPNGSDYRPPMSSVAQDVESPYTTQAKRASRPMSALTDADEEWHDTSERWS